MPNKSGMIKFGSRFLFEFFLETMHGPMLEGFRKYLSSISAEDIPGMVHKGQFPPVEDIDFSAVAGNVEHIEKISLLRFMEFIAEARPDLAGAIQDEDKAGAEYIADLRVYLLGKIRQPAEGNEFKLEEGMVLAIEPKIGIPGFGMVGTENTFEVTVNGGQALTGDNYEIISI